MWFILEEGAIRVLGSTDVSFVERINNDLRCAIEIICLDNVGGDFIVFWTARLFPRGRGDRFPPFTLRVPAVPGL